MVVVVLKTFAIPVVESSTSSSSSSSSSSPPSTVILQELTSERSFHEELVEVMEDALAVYLDMAGPVSLFRAVCDCEVELYVAVFFRIWLAILTGSY